MERAGRSYLRVAVTDPVLILSRTERICHPCVLSVSSLHLKENWKNRNHSRIFILSAQSVSSLRKGIAFPEAGTRMAVWAGLPAARGFPHLASCENQKEEGDLRLAFPVPGLQTLCWRKSRAAFLLFG